MSAVLTDLARARRARRLVDVDIFERLYQAYLSVIAVGMVVLVGAGMVGDGAVAGATVERIASDGPALVGVVASLVLIIGLRSGTRGGPLTLEAPFVAHVLLSPVGRDQALRGPAIRQLTQAALAGAGTGGLAGLLAGHRLPMAELPVLAWAAAAGAAVAVAAAGMAMVVAGLPVPKPIVHAVCLALAAGSIADVLAGTAWSPGSVVGRMAVSGVRFDAAGLVAAPIAVVLGVAGVAVVGGTSIEAARRRAGLVSQLRFAVTRQDLRTVVLLQRRLAQDAARRRPWFRVPSGRRAPVFRRGLRSMARLPLVRVLRLVSLCTVAVLAAVGAWRGTSPLIVVTALALWAAGLDVIEPLAQELDHPTRWASYPVGPGDLLLRHLVAPFLVLLVATGLPVAAVAVIGDGGLVVQVALGVALPACAAAVLGAAASVATGPFDIATVQTLMPETVGTQMLFRLAWPPGIVVLACLPLLAGPSAPDHDLSPFQATSQYALPICIMLGLAGVWLTRRKAAIT